MNDRLRAALELFEAALDQPEADRRRFVAGRCGDDIQLLDEVLQLLDLDRRADPRLDESQIAERRAELEQIASEGEGTIDVPPSIGPFRVVRRIGGGGMGEVFEVEQQSPRRRVALKLLRSSRGGEAERRRFVRETELLARLQHPGIAQIHSVGEVDLGRGEQPYFVMELVRGADLRRWARGRLREERLRVFLGICEAVHYAHTVGVVHRDLKPENILVDRAGLPRVLDLGVARVVDPGLDLSTMRTEVGQLVGTLAYMSPEQARGDSNNIDARSDVFSLGVILFELLAGHLPHRVEGRPAPEALRTICEDDPTPLGANDLSLRGDLDNIVRRALEKEPRRRYPTAEALADDLRRHLSHQPVEARAPSRIYKAGRFARRHRGLTLGLSIAFAALVSATAISTRFAMLAEAERRVAEDERQVAEGERARADATAYGLALILADAALEEGRVEQADKLLYDIAEGLRGWEWRLLEARLERHLWSAPCSADVPIAADRRGPARVAFSRDGRHVATLLSERALGVWSVATGDLVATVESGASISASGYALGTGEAFVGTEAGEVIRFDLDQARVVATVEAAAAVTSLALDGRGERLAIATAAGAESFEVTIGPWGRVDVTLPQERRVVDLGFARRDSTLVVADHDDRGWERRVLFDAATGGRVGHLGVDSTGMRHSEARMATAPLGESIAIGTTYQKINVWDASAVPNDEGWLPDSRGLSDPARTDVTHAAQDLHGTRLATSTVDGALRVWDLASGSIVDQYRVRGAASVGLGPAGRYAALVSRGQLRLIDLERADGPTTLNDGSSALWYAKLSPDGTTLATVPRDGHTRLWDLPEQRLIGRIDPGVCYSNDMWMMGRLQIAWAVDGMTLVTYRAMSGFYNMLELDTAIESTFERESRCSVVELTRRWLATLGHVRSSRQRVFDPTGSVVANLANATLESVADGEVLARLEGYTPKGETPSLYNLDASFAPEGDRLAVAWDSVGIHDAATGRRLATLDISPQLKTYAVEWSPDGSRLATGANDGRISIWDAETFTPLLEFKASIGFVHDLEWHPDGQRLISVDGAGETKVWDSLPTAERRTLDRQILERRGELIDHLESLGSSLTARDLAAAIRTDERLDESQRRIALGLVRARSFAEREVGDSE